MVLLQRVTQTAPRRSCIHVPLHSRSVLYKVKNEFVRDIGQMLQDFYCTIHQIRFVILDLPFLAKGSDQFMSPFQVMSGQGGEQMMVDLVLEAAAEPIDKGLGDSVSSGNVARGGDLEFPKVGSLVRIVHGHTIVSQTKDQGEHEPARARDEEKVRARVGQGETTKAGRKNGHPGVVQKDSQSFQNGVLQALGFELECGVFGSSAQSVGHFEGFVEPREACEQQNGKVENGLIANRKASKRRAAAIFGILVVSVIVVQIGARLCETPRQEWHGINVWISVLRRGSAIVQIGHRVVSIVFVFPPLHRVSLHEIAPVQSAVVAVPAILAHLVMQKVVGEPAALLEKESQENRTRHVHVHAIRVVDHGDRECP